MALCALVSAILAVSHVRPGKTTLCVVCVLVSLGDPLTAHASAPDVRARALELFEQAERDDATFAFGRALVGYEGALRLDPSMPKAMRADQRANAIRDRSEGDFAPLVALERVRRDPKLASDPDSIAALVKAADSFPPGLVRVEAWTLAAEAYANRLERPNDAVPLWRRVAADPSADPVIARAALRALAMHHLARGEWGSAEAVVNGAPFADDKLQKDVRRAVRRHRLHLASITTLVATVVLAAAAIVKAVRDKRMGIVFDRIRAWIWLVVGYAAYVAIGGALLASGYEEGTARPFLLFGIVLVPILLIARAWGAAGGAARAARGVRATMCATSTLAAAFLVLEHVDVAYLEGLGL